MLEGGEESPPSNHGASRRSSCALVRIVERASAPAFQVLGAEAVDLTDVTFPIVKWYHESRGAITGTAAGLIVAVTGVIPK
jgi:hypothetical protein